MIGQLLAVLAAVVLGFAPGGALAAEAPLKPVTMLDLDRYLGTWYEIAKYPNWFEKGLVAIKPEYSLRKDGAIRVVNSGLEGSFAGDLKSYEGKAWIPDADAPGELRVSFLWPFASDYWVIALDPDHRWVVVGDPERSDLWIESRTPTLPAATYAQILRKISDLGYDPSRLVRTPQPQVGHADDDRSP